MEGLNQIGEIISFRSPDFTAKLENLKKIAEQQRLCGTVVLLINIMSKNSKGDYEGKLEIEETLIEFGDC